MVVPLYVWDGTVIDAVRKESYLTFRNNMGTPKVIATLSFFSSKDIVWKFDWINLYIYLISLFLIFFFSFLFQMDLQWSSPGKVQCKNGWYECTNCKTKGKQETEGSRDSIMCWKFASFFEVNLLLTAYNSLVELLSKTKKNKALGGVLASWFWHIRSSSNSVSMRTLQHS